MPILSAEFAGAFIADRRRPDDGGRSGIRNFSRKLGYISGHAGAGGMPQLRLAFHKRFFGGNPPGSQASFK
jgi:hypothetical protein